MWCIPASFISAIIALLIVLKLYTVFTRGRCRCKTCLVGKTVLVTGSHRGLGYETALDLASRGARVIITSNDEDGVMKARDKIISITGNPNIVAKRVDYFSLEDIRAFAKDILQTEERLDILINNVGSVENIHGRKTKDDLIPGLQVNYFGAFLLTHLLLGLLKKSGRSRIVNISSCASICSVLNKENINSNVRVFAGYTGQHYCNGKYLLNAMTFELADRLRGSGVTVNAVHPGTVKTDIYTAAGFIIYYGLRMLIGSLLFKTVQEGAEPIIHVALSPEFGDVTGKYTADCHVSYFHRPIGKKIRKRIWEQSIKLVKLQPDEICC